MKNTRFKDVNWDLPTTPEGGIKTWEAVQIAVMMDIRDELKRLNGTLACPNFLAIPSRLEKMRLSLGRMDRRAGKG